MSAVAQAPLQAKHLPPICISLGGSALYSSHRGEDWNDAFVQKFIAILAKYSDREFIIVVGGGPVARENIKRAARTTDSPFWQDIAGVHATRDNAAHLRNAIREALGDSEVTGTIPESAEILGEMSRRRITISGGWEPGGTTDKDTVLAAEAFNAPYIINISNIAFLYTKDPKKRGAKPLKRVSYDRALRIALRPKDGDRREPGSHFPIDSIALLLARRRGKVIHFIGSSDQALKDLEAIIEGRPHVGTVIGDLKHLQRDAVAHSHVKEAGAHPSSAQA